MVVIFLPVYRDHLRYRNACFLALPIKADRGIQRQYVWSRDR
ncbi:hypothetical protein [Metallosphaera javensis (ex Sakai et al. 2022)]